MKLTRYRRIFSSPVRFPGKLVLFSTRTAASLLVPKTMLEEIERGSITAEERRTLEKHGFLVANADIEKREMRVILDELALIDRVFKPIVVLNLDCNLACTYCFEGQRKGKHYLSDRTAGNLLLYFRECALPGRQEVNVTFYGGEPLLSMERMTSLAVQIGALAAAGGIPFNFSLVTNGTLLTRDRVETLRPLGLKSASVTVDGPRATHDAARPFRSGKGSYDTILGNLRAVHDLVDLQIGGNYTRENFREFPRLLDDLAANGLTPEVISHVRFDPVFRERDGVAPPDFHGSCTSPNEPWLFEASVFLRGEILRRGYRTSRIMPSPCMMDLSQQPVIDHDGTLYKCPGLIGREEFRAGDLVRGPIDCRSTHHLDNWKNDACLECPYLPLCFGGCRYLKLLRTGDLSGVDCRKTYFDAVLEPLALQDIRYHVGN